MTLFKIMQTVCEQLYNNQSKAIRIWNYVWRSKRNKKKSILNHCKYLNLCWIKVKIFFLAMIQFYSLLIKKIFTLIFLLNDPYVLKFKKNIIFDSNETVIFYTTTNIETDGASIRAFCFASVTSVHWFVWKLSQELLHCMNVPLFRLSY